MPADALRGVHAGQTTEPEVSAKLLASSGRNWWQAFGIEDPLLKKSDKESQLCNLCTLQFSPFTCASALSADVAYHLLALHTAGIHRKWLCHVDMDLLWRGVFKIHEDPILIWIDPIVNFLAKGVHR